MLAADLADRLRSAPPRAGGTRVLAVDGRSGAGKSSLAAQVHAELPGAALVALEDLYGGWDGLAEGIGRLVSAVLAPLAVGAVAAVPRYDWVAARWLDPTPLPPPKFLIVEGVGAGALAVAPYLSLLVWLEASADTRKRRALARDGETYAPHWDRWAAQENTLLSADHTPDRADVIITVEN